MTAGEERKDQELNGFGLTDEALFKALAEGLDGFPEVLNLGVEGLKVAHLAQQMGSWIVGPPGATPTIAPHHGSRLADWRLFRHSYWMQGRDGLLVTQLGHSSGTDTGLPGTLVLDEPETGHEERLAPLWKVICHDDPITTMEFVVDMLTKIFRQPLPRAMELMLRVDSDGSAVIGLWPESVARKKVNRAHAMARAELFPLTLSLEEDS